jgi:aldehyde dehydrogenase (NAD+)
MTSFRDEGEAAEWANATLYGLVAGVRTRGVTAADSLARELRAGQVFVNGFGARRRRRAPVQRVEAVRPRTRKGFEALLTYTRTKTVAVSL